MARSDTKFAYGLSLMAYRVWCIAWSRMVLMVLMVLMALMVLTVLMVLMARLQSRIAWSSTR
ncbi:MAG: hypothetical protein KGJ13_07550 [Patescibacteria group bacterium]|nr:hypothetical protein [Patescibacteria group bacterium]